MHYANGREAKNGDKVALVPYNGNVVVGVLYDAQAGNDFCNGKLAVISPTDPMPNLKECLHLDDVLALIPLPESEAVPTTLANRIALVPDISKPPSA